VLLMTRNDVDIYIEQLIQIVANKLGFNEASSNESYREYVGRVNVQIYEAFESFVINYNAWYGFHAHRCSGSSNEDTYLTDEQTNTLYGLISDRDEARLKLQDLVASHGSIQHVLSLHVDDEEQMDRDLKERSQKAKIDRLRK